MARSLSSGLPPDFGLSETLMSMWWNEHDSIDTVLTFGAPDRPSQMVGGISGQMSTAPVRRLCAMMSSFWNRIQVTFCAAGLAPQKPSLRATSMDWPCFQFTNL